MADGAGFRRGCEEAIRPDHLWLVWPLRHAACGDGDVRQQRRHQAVARAVSRGAGPALTALLGGTVEAIAAAPGTLKPQVDDGKLRVLGNCGAQRIASFPDVPTFQELGYKDVEMYIWAGLFAQSALPAPIARRLRQAEGP